jgi:hypothetical protein
MRCRIGPAVGELALQPVGTPAIRQRVDGDAEEDETQDHDVEVAVRKEQVAERSEEILESAHRPQLHA